MLRSLFVRHKAVGFGLGLVLALAAVAALAPVLAPYPPEAQDLAGGLSPPNHSHWMGQDKLGRDILSRIIYGARVSLYVGLVTVAISCVVGVSLGAWAGYRGGKTDEVLMRVTDVFLAFPGILLAIAIMAIVGPGLNNVVIALCLVGWVGYARLARGQILSVKEREYSAAAIALGASSPRVLFRHLLPNALSPLLVEATFGTASAVLAEAGLSFLGLGVQPPQSSWGAMLNEGRQFLLVAPHMTLFPGLAIMIVVLGFNIAGDGIRDALDPRGRAGAGGRRRGRRFAPARADHARPDRPQDSGGLKETMYSPDR